jgi:hypothetical protein
LATAIQYVNEGTFVAPEETVSARWMMRFFLASYITIMFTGAVRKWMFPGVSALYLLQDIPIGISYVWAILTGLYTRSYLLVGIILLSMVLTLQALFQIVVPGLELFVAGVGLHNYLFYLPMLVVFPLCLTEKNRERFVWWNLMLSIPMCILAVVQARSPKGAWINHTSEGDAFGVPGADIARVSGTFNFTVFYGVWVALAVALCLGEWLLPRERRAIKNLWLLTICTFAVNICHLVSGSRSAIALAGAAVVGAMVAAIVMGSTRTILTIGGICILLPVAAGATYLISPAEFNIITERFTGDEYVEDNKNRVTDALIGFTYVPKFSMVGAGIGMGVDAAHAGSADTYNYTYQLSENDMIRVVMELGTPVGLLYALTRIAFVSGMILLSVRIVRDGSSPHVLPLAFFLFAQTYIGDLTRAATMTSSQVMLGYAFILGAYYYPDNISLEEWASESTTRSE